MSKWRWFWHDVMQWLRPSGAYSFDGVSVGTTCRDCPRRILMDSQGNWFHVGRPRPAKDPT